jgi:proton-coupled amino acid transporter
MLMIQIPLSWIRDIRKLTPTNALANALILYGLLVCLGFALMTAIQQQPPLSSSSSTMPVVMLEENATTAPSELSSEDALQAMEDPLDDTTKAMLTNGPLAQIMDKLRHLTPFNADGWFLFIGVSVLLFEGSITLLIPLQEAVATPQDRKAFPKLYSFVILGIIAFYTFFGMFCWMAFGNDVDIVMTTSLPPGAFLATSVQLAYSVAVILTFPLQNFPSLEIACTAIAESMQRILLQASSCCGDRHRSATARIFLPMLTSRNAIASVLVCLLGVIAFWTMERLDKVVSLMGSLLGCPLAFCFPPLIQNALDERFANALSTRQKWQNNLVALIGLGAMVIASAATLLTW